MTSVLPDRERRDGSLPAAHALRDAALPAAIAECATAHQTIFTAGEDALLLASRPPRTSGCLFNLPGRAISLQRRFAASLVDFRRVQEAHHTTNCSSPMVRCSGGGRPQHRQPVLHAHQWRNFLDRRCSLRQLPALLPRLGDLFDQILEQVRAASIQNVRQQTPTPRNSRNAASEAMTGLTEATTPPPYSPRRTTSWATARSCRSLTGRLGLIGRWPGLCRLARPRDRQNRASYRGIPTRRRQRALQRGRTDPAGEATWC
jgi:hypothetical protein